MSTDYRMDLNPTKKQFLAAAKKVGVKEHITPETTKDSFCITDGDSYIWCYIYKGKVTSMARFGGNYDGEDFLRAIAEELHTELLSEHDEDYYEDEDYE